MRTCPHCKTGVMIATKTRSYRGGARRTLRACNSCGHQLSSFQIDVDVSKGNGHEFVRNIRTAQIIAIHMVKANGEEILVPGVLDPPDPRNSPLSED